VSRCKGTIRLRTLLTENRSKVRPNSRQATKAPPINSSAEHKQQFESSPAKYEPQFGGFCGYAASINKLAPIEVHYFQVLHDRLILQHNEKAWKLWHQDVEGNLKKADANWPTLSQQKPPAS
jgi:hypothetical protein